jgi:hypothetical protein
MPEVWDGSRSLNTGPGQRAQLDEATFAAAWAEGRAMPLDQVVADALSLSD